MESKELRIGNWIFDRGDKAWQIDCWEHSTKVAAKEPVIGFCDFTKKPMHGHPLTEEVCFLKPIPLTEEWLLKFGFEKTGCDYWTIKRSSFELGQSEEGFVNSINCYEYSNGIEIKHVHQLQNLYFALTGEELTVK